MELLPVDVLNLIQDFAGANSYWHNRFSEDVLSLINKQYIFVSVDSGSACASCYITALRRKNMFDQCIPCSTRSADVFESMNFEEYKNSSFVREDLTLRIFANIGFEATCAAFCDSRNNIFNRFVLNDEIKHNV